MNAPNDAAHGALPTTAAPVRFRDRSIALRKGSVGCDVEVPSANPINYYQAISRAAEMPRVTIDGKCSCRTPQRLIRCRR